MITEKLPKQSKQTTPTANETEPKSIWRFILPLLIVSVTTLLLVASVKSNSSSNTLTNLKRKPDDAHVYTASSSKPNIIFILADDLGWNSIGYELYDLSFTTPYITSLAKQGIVMNNYYGQEVCTPSRASLMTGRYPITIGKSS